MLPRLFDAMVSARDEGRGRGGHLGLGLAIVRLVAEYHGGAARAINLPGGRGVLFEWKCPWAKPPAACRGRELKLGVQRLRRTLYLGPNPPPAGNRLRHLAPIPGLPALADEGRRALRGPRRRGHGRLRALRREHAAQRCEGGGRQVHLPRPRKLQAREMTPAALATGVPADSRGPATARRSPRRATTRPGAPWSSSPPIASCWRWACRAPTPSSTPSSSSASSSRAWRSRRWSPIASPPCSSSCRPCCASRACRCR